MILNKSFDAQSVADPVDYTDYTIPFFQTTFVLREFVWIENIVWIQFSISV